MAIWLLRVVSAPLARLSQTAASLVRGSAVSFRAERDDEIGTLATVLEQLRLDLEGRYAAAVADADRAATYNKLADLISFSVVGRPTGRCGHPRDPATDGRSER